MSRLHTDTHTHTPLTINTAGHTYHSLPVLFLCLKKIVSEPSAVRAWKKSFSELPNWSDCFVNIYKSSKDNKLIQFTFKVVHRIITTKKELLKYKLASDDKCPFCLNPDSIEHTFLYCQESKEFFSKTLRWFNEYHKENVQLSNR